jgi:threonine/homoserine/homoserine lactone efflux protein
MRLAKIFFWGMLISFLGTLPFSTLNITAMQISLQESIRNGMYFSLGTLVAEMILVRIALVGINWVRKQKVVFKWFEWITLIIIVAFAIGSFIAATKENGAKNIMLTNNIDRFILGIVMSALTPMHIPFWFAWSTVLFTKNILKPGKIYYNVYVIAIGLGTFLANCIYILGGKLIVNKLNANENILNWVLGAIFALTAIIQLVKILWHKDEAEKLETLGN